MAQLARLPGGEGARHPLSELENGLRELAARYREGRLDSDPLGLVRPFADPRDREVAGIIASGLAFGGVRAVRASVKAVLEALGRRPARNLLRGAKSRRLSGFRHRWISGEDVSMLLLTLRAMLRKSGSVEAYFAAGHEPEADHVGPALDSFSRRAKETAERIGRPGRGFRYFFPEPSAGSAVKRLNLFLRWMVRPDDGVDLGVWTRVKPRQLVIPLDTHVAQVARAIGLTERKSAGFATALDITRSLRRLFPRDPVRYDFAIAQMGISRDCRHRRDPERCPTCPLESVCRWTREAR